MIDGCARLIKVILVKLHIIHWISSTWNWRIMVYQCPTVRPSVRFMVKFRIFIPELWDFIHQIVRDFKAMFRMSRCKLRTTLSIHFKLRIFIRIDSRMVCILFGEISIFHSRVMGLYSSNCRRFFVCRAVNWELLRQWLISSSTSK
jgi:hypothetical protein